MEGQSSSCKGAEESYTIGGSCGDGESSSYECNICLEVAEEEPVVTLCGHLFCCACIYRWLHLHSQSLQCPVCKAYLPKLIPLSSRQQSPSSQYYHQYSLCNQQNMSAPTTSITLEGISGHPSYTMANISAASGLFSLLLLGFHGGFAHLSRLNGRPRVQDREEEEESAAAHHREENFVCSLLGFLACFVIVCLISF